MKELLPAGWHLYTPDDAHFLGRLTVIGIAPPNAPQLHQPVAPVTNFDTVQDEINRLVEAGEAIASIPGVGFGGLHHNQLASSDASPPLDIFLSPVDTPELPVEITIGDRAFRAFVNTHLELLPGSPQQLSGEGCFSSVPVSVVVPRYAELAVYTSTSDGEHLYIENVGGFGAKSVQHEHAHGLGDRGADDLTIVRNWVSRARLPEFLKIPPEERAARWTDTCTEAQWQALSRDPGYPFFPTKELQDAYAAGRDAQRRAAWE